MPTQVNIRGKIGQRVTVDIDYDRDDNTSENTVQVQYKALRRREFVREVTIGNIDLSIPESEFAVFEKKSKKTVGLDAKMRRGKLSFHGVATLSQGESAKETFTGMNKSSSLLLKEYSYTPRKYYQLEPFLYYGDGCSPTITSSSYIRGDAQALRTFTSTLNTGETFVGTAVSIDSSSVKVYLDDRNSRNNSEKAARPLSEISARALPDSLGTYHLLTSGRDYILYPESGRIIFPAYLSPESRVFIQYKRSGGQSTCDPSASEDGTGTIETFLKWNTSLHEDTSRNGIGGTDDDVTVIADGQPNLDIYEIRGIYETGSTNIDESDFSLTILDNAYNVISSTSQLGSYNIDYSAGQVLFALREPFLNVRDSSGNYYIDDISRYILYTDNQKSTVAESTSLQMRLEYSHSLQSYQLRHGNILQGTVKVKVNDRLVSQDKYYVDYYSGYFSFFDMSDPQIGPGTTVEISYDYSPYGTSQQGFITGVRSEYQATRDLKLGSTVLYSGQFLSFNAPSPGQEPSSQLVTEVDGTLHYREEKMTSLINSLTGADFDLLPVEMTTYVEAARTIYNRNTYDMALIDDLESSEDIYESPLSEEDWILGSPPTDPLTSTLLDQCSRVPLLYRYYRDPSDPRVGLLPLSSSPRASPAYTTLSGPYNVAEGHLDTNQLKTDQSEKQTSLVLDYDFTAKPSTAYASVVTRNLGSVSKDLSEILYIEFNARIVDSTGPQSLFIYIDAGTVDEDSDGDGNLDSEDLGFNQTVDSGGSDPHEGNFLLDYERDSGKTEDKGYLFDPPSCSSDYTTYVGRGPNISGYSSTSGNGVLDLEDLDRDGVLNTDSSFVTIPDGSSAFSFDSGGDNTITPGDWKHFRIVIDRQQLSDDQIASLSDVRALRIFIMPDGTAAAGKLLIDGIKFSSPRWRNPRGVNLAGDTASVTSPYYLSYSIIDNFNSKDEYDSKSFLHDRRSEYEEIHGKYTNTEYEQIQEAALKIVYDFQSQYKSFSLTRYFSDPLDLSYYGKFHIWGRVRQKSGGESLILRLGTSEDDYYEYRTSLKDDSWQNYSFALDSPVSTQGRPNLKQVSYIQAGIASSDSTASGEVWLNDMTVSDVKLETDDAWKYETTIKITKPLYKTRSGTPVLSDIAISYSRKHRGRYFYSIGQEQLNYSEDRQLFQIDTNVFPWWYSSYSLTNVHTNAKEEDTVDNPDYDGDNIDFRQTVKNDFEFSRPGIPSVYTLYNYQLRRQNLREYLDDGTTTGSNDRIASYQKEITHAPSVILKEKKKITEKSYLEYTLETNLSYYSNATQRVNIDQDNTILEKDLEKVQFDKMTNRLKYQFHEFSITPEVSQSRKFLVEKLTPDNNVFNQLDGDFVFPYTRAPEFLYNQRITQAEIETQWQITKYLLSSVLFSTDYQENSFQDSELSQSTDKYQRIKQPATRTASSFSIPIKPSLMYKKLSFFDSITPQYTREILLSEVALPFTRNSSLFEDELGAPRTVPPLANLTYNIFSFPFWYFFQSKDRPANTFSNGREYVQTTKMIPNLSESESDLLLNYTNSLSLNERASVPLKFRFFREVLVTNDFSLSQNATRSALTSLPTQNVVFSISARESVDLMRLYKMKFLKKRGGISLLEEFHYSQERQMHITDNIQEDVFAPGTIFTYGWESKRSERRTFSVFFDYRLSFYRNKGYLSINGPDNDRIIAEDIAERTGNLRKREHNVIPGLEFTTEIETWRRALSRLTALQLRQSPVYSARFTIDLNRFYYSTDESISDSTTLDRFLLEQGIEMNLHQNVTGEFSLATAWDVHRDLYTKEIKQEILALQMTMGAKILF